MSYTARHLPPPQRADLLSGIQIKLSLLFMLASAMPALYAAPAILGLVFLVSCARIPELVVQKPKTQVGFPVYSLFACLIIIYCIFSAIVSGLSVGQILSYEAIRYDANIFYSFLPFFLIRITAVSLSEIDRWISAISKAAPVAYIASTAVGFSLFESHNAAGGFFMVLAAYVMGRVVTDGFRQWWMPILLLTAGLVASASRGSLVAVLGVLVLHKAFVHMPRTSRAILALFLIGTASFLIYAYGFWQSKGALYLYDYSGFASEVDGLDLEALLVGERPGTVLHRLFFLYPMAVDMFLHSPIWGVGFTRFDDFPFDYFHGIPFAAVNVTNSVLHTNFHAHNSYLHILAELGLVGFGLFCMLVSGILRTFRFERRIGIPAGFLLGVLLIASITEHRFTTPSQAAPVFLMISILWSCMRSSSGCCKARL